MQREQVPDGIIIIVKFVRKYLQAVNTLQKNSR